MNQNRINEIYKTLDDITFAIPDFNSPDEITTAIFNCRDRINQVEKLAIETHRAIAKVRKNLLSKKKERQIKYSSLMRESAEVKKGKSGLDRQAIAESLLADIDNEIGDLESQMTEVKYLNEAIDLRVSNLNKTNSDIRLAWSVMQNTSTIVSRDMSPQETTITAEDLEGIDVGAVSKDIEPIALSAEDLSNLDIDEKKKKPSTTKEEPIAEDEEGFSFDAEEPELDYKDEEVGDPVNLEQVSKKQEKKEKKETPEKKETTDSIDEPKQEVKDEEDTFTESISSSPDDIDIEEFLADL